MYLLLLFATLNPVIDSTKQPALALNRPRIEEYIRRIEQKQEIYIDSIIEMGSAAVPWLCKRLVSRRGQNIYLQIKICKILGKLMDNSAVLPLINCLNSSSHSLRGASAEALGEIGDTSAIFSLFKLLRDKHDAVRGDAASALGKIGDIRAADSLISVLKDPVFMNRAKAVEALGKIQAKTSAFYLKKLLINDPAHIVRMNAAIALANLKDASAVVLLIQALQDSSVFVAEKAAFAIGELGDARVINPLTNAMSDPSADGLVRTQIVKAFAKIDGEKSIIPLLKATQDTEAEVRERAEKALDRLAPSFIVLFWDITKNRRYEIALRRGAFTRLIKISNLKSQISNLKSIYPKCKKKIYISIIEGKVIKGMTKDQVLLTLGAPRRTAQSPYFEEWDYGRNKPLIEFEQGIVK